MAQVVMGAIGAGIGSMFGNPQLGFSFGVMLAGEVFPGKQSRGKGTDLRGTDSIYGVMIPQVWGRDRVGGQILWQTPLAEHTRNQGGKGILAPGVPTTYYTADVAVGVCQGPISAIRRIWAEDVLIYDASATPTSKYTLRLYTGDETQAVDTLIASVQGAGQWTAYRGLCYFVIEGLNLEPWGNRLPAFSAEIDTTPTYPALMSSRTPLEAYYRFESSGADSSGLGRNLTGGSPTYVAGKYNQGVYTGASSMAAVVGQVAGLQPAELTLSFWLRWSGASATSTDEWLFENPVTGERAWQIYVDWLSQQLKLNTKSTASETTLNVISFPRTTTWTNVVATFKAGGYADGHSRLYVNGLLVDEQPGNPIVSLAITANAANQIRFSGGSITETYWDEAAVYSRAWTAEEVAQAYTLQGTTVGAILADVFRQVGLQTSQYDVTRATDPVDGYHVAERRPAAEQIKPLLEVFATDLAEADYQLYAVRRGETEVLTLAAADLGARTDGGEPVSALERRREQDLELPQRLELNYFSSARQFQSSTQAAIRSTKGLTVTQKVTVDTALVLTDDRAAHAAHRLLWTRWLERTGYRFSLGPKHLKLAPGSCVNLPVHGASVRVRILRMEIGQFAELRFEAVKDDRRVIDQVATGAAAAVTAPTLSQNVPTTFTAWSTPQVRDEDGWDPGFYVAGTGATGWTVGTVYYSPDGGTDWLEGGLVQERAVFGTTTTALDDGTSTTVVDTTSDVDVTLSVAGTLATTSQAEVDAGENAALVGGEILGFATATVLGTLQYRLTTMRRGRRSTAMTGHGSTERFVLLTEACVRVTVPTALIGATVRVKVVSPGQSLADVTAQNVVIATPVAPVGGGDIAATGLGSTLVSTSGTTMASLLPLTAVDATFAGQLINEDGTLLYADA